MRKKVFEVSTAKILPLPILQAFSVNAISKFQQISTSALTEQSHEKYGFVGKKNNANYIDLARFIAIYAVVLGHFHPFVGMDNIVGRKLIYICSTCRYSSLFQACYQNLRQLKKQHTH